MIKPERSIISKFLYKIIKALINIIDYFVFNIKYFIYIFILKFYQKSFSKNNVSYVYLQISNHYVLHL